MRKSKISPGGDVSSAEKLSMKSFYGTGQSVDAVFQDTPLFVSPYGVPFLRSRTVTNNGKSKPPPGSKKTPTAGITIDSILR